MGLKKMGDKRTDGEFLRNIVMGNNEDMARLWKIAERLDWLDRFQECTKEIVEIKPHPDDDDGDPS